MNPFRLFILLPVLVASFIGVRDSNAQARSYSLERLETGGGLYSVTPMGISDDGTLLTSSLTAANGVLTYRIGTSNGDMRDVREVTGIESDPLYLAPDGTLLLKPTLESEGCFINIYDRTIGLRKIPLPADLPCNAPNGILGPNGEIALLSVGGTTFVTTIHLTVKIGDSFSSYLVSNSGAGDSTDLQNLSGFLDDGSVLITSVTGATTAIYEPSIFSTSGLSPLAAKIFNGRNVIHSSTSNGISLIVNRSSPKAFVGRLSGSTVKGIRQIKVKGLRVSASDVNSNGVAVGIADNFDRAFPYVWSRKRRAEDLKRKIRGRGSLRIRSVDLINDRGQIAGTASGANGLIYPFVLTPRARR